VGTLKNCKPGDLLITSDCYCVSPALYYFPGADHYFYVNRFEKDWEFTFDALRPYFIELQNTHNLYEKYKSFWIIKNSLGFSVREYEIIRNITKWKEGEQDFFAYPYSEIGFSVSKYEYTGNNSSTNGGK
jgi:hypothetical protein